MRLVGAVERSLWTASVALVTVLVNSCQTNEGAPPAGTQPGISFPADEYRRLAARDTVYVLDPQASSVRIFVHRGGPLAQLGHSHVVAVTDFRGAVYLPDDPAGARFDLVFPLRATAVDRPADRATAAGGFDSELDAGAAADTRDNMLGPRVLDAQRFPRIGLRSIRVTGELPVLEITFEVALRGMRHKLTVPVWIERAGDRLVAEGQFRLRQSRFGIEPFSALAGALRVRDALGIRFRLVGRRRAEP